MTALMVLALTVPPSLAAAACCWMSLRQSLAVQLTKAQRDVIESLGNDMALHRHGLEANAARFDEQGTELKRLAEQVTSLTERVYRQ